VFDKLALLIDPLSKNFELTTDLTVDDSIALFGLDALVNYYGLLDPYNMHLNYVGENTFMYKLFSSEGLELTYDRLSSTSCHVLMDGVNCSEPKLDISENFLVKTLSAFYVRSWSFLMFWYSFFCIFFFLHISSNNYIFKRSTWILILLPNVY